MAKVSHSQVISVGLGVAPAAAIKKRGGNAVIKKGGWHGRSREGDGGGVQVARASTAAVGEAGHMKGQTLANRGCRNESKGAHPI